MKKNSKIHYSLIIMILIIAQSLSNDLYPQSAQQDLGNNKISAPSLSFVDENNKKLGLEIKLLDIEIKIVGKLAVTTIDLTFHNNLNRILEGELDFPLADGQSVSRFAMELNGKLREGVVVEKAKGRIAYESTIRQKIDPALLEKTSGNSFRSRVYPIPARGDKRIVIAYEEIIRENEDGMIYQLPLNYLEKITKFKLLAKIYGNEVLEENTGKQFDDLQIQKNGSAYVLAVEYNNFLANKQFDLMLKSPDKRKSVMVEGHKNKNYFYLDINTFGESKTKNYPESICILWDASSSSTNRNIAEEIKLLNEYLKLVNNCKVHLVVFSNAIHSEKDFIIQNGNTSELEKELNNIQYDGGTQLGILNLKKYKASEFLLFSDGMSNFGKNEIDLSNVPINSINSNQIANHSYLKYISQTSGGKYINLTSQDIDKGLELLGMNPYQFISAEYLSNEIEQTYPSIPQAIDGSLILTGILKSDRAKIKLNFGYGNEVTNTEVIEINKDKNQTESGLINRIWSQKKLAELDIMYEKNKEEILNLGKEFNLITRGSSLIILDRVQDYVTHKIIPPEELLDEYNDLMNENAQRNLDDSLNFERMVIQNFKNEINWWEKNFEIPKVVKKVDTNIRVNSAIVRSSVPTNGTATIQGRVFDEDGLGLVGTSIFVEGTNRGAYVRNEDGSFQITNIPIGTYNLRFAYTGMKTAKKGIILDTNSINELEVVLTADSIIVSEILVISNYESVENDRQGSVARRISDEENSNLDSIDISSTFTGGFGAAGLQNDDGVSEFDNFARASSVGGDGVDLGGFSANIDLGERREVVSELRYDDGGPAFAQDVPDGSVTLIQLADEVNRQGGDLSGELPNPKLRPSIPNESTNALSGTMTLEKESINNKLLKSILGSGIDSVYYKYLFYKKENINNIDYYIVVADAFMKLNDTANALRVISNLAELKLEDYQTLRILGYKLKEYGEFDLSEMIFREIMKLREEEPQSYRDLALVLADKGKLQEAADLLYQIAFKKWDERFMGIDVIVLNELNRLIALNPDKIQTNNYNPEVIKNMPIDIRVVLNWDTDNTDIDLMLTDPLGINCYYENMLTKVGCKISDDFTGGYGPEEIKLKNAIPGKYIVSANYFGSRSDKLNLETTITLELFIKYASKDEEKQEITLKLKERKNSIKIGEFIFE